MSPWTPAISRFTSVDFPDPEGAEIMKTVVIEGIAGRGLPLPGQSRNLYQGTASAVPNECICGALAPVAVDLARRAFSFALENRG